MNPITQPASPQGILRQASALLPDSPSARLDLEALLCHCCGYSRAQLITQGEKTLSTEQFDNFLELLQRRQAGEPIAYVTGEREFWSMALRVDKATLIPRPETELLVEQALLRLPDEANYCVADLGTGSGAVALALGKERPRCQLLATDISAAALAVAQHNAAQLGLANITFLQGDWLAPLAPRRCHMLVSNPPYIREGDPHLLQGDVRFEPPQALAAGDDGLDAIRQLIKQASDHLLPGGWLLLEHGYDQAQSVRELFRESGYQHISSVPDLRGLERVSLGQLG